MLSDVIFSSLSGQSFFPCFYNGQFTISWVPLAAKLLKSHQIETKTSISNPRPIVKTQFEFAVWHHFPMAARPILHSFFYNGQFTIIWVPLTTKLLKSHQTETKNLYMCPKAYC